MNGQQEVSGTPPNVTFAVGDPDGSGTAKITLNHGQGRVCWKITVDAIAADPDARPYPRSGCRNERSDPGDFLRDRPAG